MERNLSFPREGIAQVRVKLTWAQVELLAGATDAFQVLIAGDDESVGEVRVELAANELSVTQPQLAYAKEILPRNRWLQICIRVPDDWKGDLDIYTMSGMLGAKKARGNDVLLTTVSGAIHAQGIECAFLSLHTVSGAIAGDTLIASRSHVRTVSGRISISNATFGSAKLFTVSGETNLGLNEGVRTLEMQSVSGVMCVEVDGPAQASLRSLSGQFLLAEDVQKPVGDSGLTITASSVSGDLAVKGRNGSNG